MNRHSVQRLRDERSDVLEVLRELVEAIEASPGAYSMPAADAPCHVGVVPQERCAHCQRVARRILALNGARNLLKSTEKST